MPKHCTITGRLALRQGDYAAALRYTVQALEIFERLSSPRRDLALETIAKLRTRSVKFSRTNLWKAVLDKQKYGNGNDFSRRNVSTCRTASLSRPKEMREDLTLP